MTHSPVGGTPNAAFQLFDLIHAWEITPAGISPWDHRTQKAEMPYPQAVKRALELTDEIDQYLKEREMANPGRTSDRTQLANIQQGILAYTVALNSADNTGARRSFDPADLSWLNHLGMSWHRTLLIPPVDAVKDILTLVGLTEDMLASMAESLDAEHLAYLNELCAALRLALRDIQNSGGQRTARLALELRGALETYLPSAEDTPNIGARIGRAVKDFSIYYAAPTLAQITATAAFMAIAPPQ